MKYLALLALAAVALNLGACAKKAETTSTTMHASHTGYTK